MGAQLHSKGAMADMNITPLIDILLVVLIIMMVNIPIQIEEMGIKLPSRETMENPPDTPIEQLVIAVYADGQLALNRKAMTEEILFYEITRRLRPMDKKNVFIDAHPDIEYGRVVDMMDLAREAGASRVGLAKLKEQGPLPVTSVAPGTMPRGVDVGLPTVVGPLSQSQADKAIDPVMGTLMGCYERALGKDPTRTGRIMLYVAIGPQGQLMETKVTSSNHGDVALDECVLQATKSGLKYEPLGEQKTAVVQYPLLFSPG